MPNLSKEKAFTALFPNKKYDDVLMRQMMSYLYKIIQKYLITEEVLSNEIESQMQLIHALRHRNSDKILEKQLSEAFKVLENQPFKSIRYHFYNYSLRKEEYENFSKKNRSAELHLQNLSDELDNYYSSERLKQASILYAHQTISKHNYTQLLLPSVIEKISDDKIAAVPAVLAYFHSYKALTEPDNIKHFLELKNTIIEKGEFSRE
ncbi:MAG: hypothetical protein HC817_09270 [Saprospiraceae bacterium]|nr:hypothetical protein [Saprospiraceae bacterium]